jgi:hypothetical protein
MLMATNLFYDMASEGNVFNKTFRYLNEALGDRAFKRWNGHTFMGKFLMSVFEVLATGISHNLAALDAMQPADRNQFIVQAAQQLWNNHVFIASSGAGVRGTTRLARLLPIAAGLLNPTPQ